MADQNHVYASNTFTVKRPEDMDRLLGLIRKGIETASSKNPGYVSDTVLKSVDGRAVLNLSRWSGGVQQLATNHEANQKNSSYNEQMKTIGEIADFVASAYTVAFEHSLNSSYVTSADVQRWIDAWNSHDIEQIIGLFSDDVVMYQPQNPDPLNKQALGKFFTMLFQSYSDIHFELQGHTIQGRDVASWERVTGTMTGEFHDPGTGQIIQPTHKKFDILGAMHLTYGDGGKIRVVRIYWDRLLLMTQLGLLKQ